MNQGKEFEQQIKDSIVKAGFYYLKIPDPPQSFGRDSMLLRFSNKSPFDYIVYKFPHMYALECKSKSTNSISIAQGALDKGKDIRYHQILELRKAYFSGAIAGFLFNFRKEEKTYFIHIFDFLQYMKNTKKKSININDVKRCHGIVVRQEKKKVKFSYDIERLVSYCEGKYEHYLSCMDKCWHPANTGDVKIGAVSE